MSSIYNSSPLSDNNLLDALCSAWTTKAYADDIVLKYPHFFTVPNWDKPGIIDVLNIREMRKAITPSNMGYYTDIKDDSGTYIYFKDFEGNLLELGCLNTGRVTIRLYPRRIAELVIRGLRDKDIL